MAEASFGERSTALVGGMARGSAEWAADGAARRVATRRFSLNNVCVEGSSIICLY